MTWRKKMGLPRRKIISAYSKYKAVKTTVDGITFASKHEAERYCELKLLLKAGAIKDLRFQVPYELQPHFRWNGKTIRAINYVADFVYIDTKTGKEIVEDAKGVRTPEYKLKAKMMLYKYQIELKET